MQMAQIGSSLYEIELDSGCSVVEHQGKYILRGEQYFPAYTEINSPDEIININAVATALQSIDWSFTDDDTSFLTHDLHPYPAKFIPQIPGNCIAQLSMPGELVLDPFGGSGTTALEAIRLGRRALSIDANAVGNLIGKVKTCNINRTASKDLHAIRSALATKLIDLPKPETLCNENKDHIPVIPNIDKWFPITSRGELALIKSCILKMESEKAIDIAMLSLSKIVLPASFQDSETRYSSKPKNIPQGETLKRFLVALDQIIKNVIRTQAAIRYGVCQFITADSRDLEQTIGKKDSIDLIITSPPYGNAMDYHLYHRFRLMWLGFDPRQLGKIEIGSHLRHQKESSGFMAYLSEMRQGISGMYRVLKPGRYAVLVLGDAVYKNELYHTAEELSSVAEEIGFDIVSLIERKIHKTKRSFIAAGRRASSEKLLVLRKPPFSVSVWFEPPPYKLWPYENILRSREIESILGIKVKAKNIDSICLEMDSYSLTKVRRLVFTHAAGMTAIDGDPTWQAIVENGFSAQTSSRKDPKYVTHGIHTYKGKFYPQLAKGLMNLCSIPPGSIVFDPFCGSGTTLLEGYLNGHKSFGSDINPLAAKIAKAKVGILEVDPDVVREAVGALVNKIEGGSVDPPERTDQFGLNCIDEIMNWFPVPVISKINWLLGSIRSVSEGVMRDFLEVVLSSIIRDVSQQAPNDLRRRRRKDPIVDADVFQLYLDALDIQYSRIEKFWTVRGYSPVKFKTSRVLKGDSRKKKTLEDLGLGKDSVDLVLTSPPYATALPYIDTDRLSLLLLFGMNSSNRRPVEHGLIGSREIGTYERRQIEEIIQNGGGGLPISIRTYLQDLFERVEKADVGFRRKNMPSLLLRFFKDMEAVLNNSYYALRPEGEAMIVIGDNRIRVDKDFERIPTTDFVEDIALSCGFELLERIDISVTTENFVHIKNAITENVVLRLLKPKASKINQA